MIHCRYVSDVKMLPDSSELTGLERAKRRLMDLIMVLFY